jgi:inorganic pyrophosphatase
MTMLTPSLKTAVSLSLICLLYSCSDEEINYYILPTFDGDYINAVVEIPAGENLKTEYNPETNTFGVELIDGQQRSVNFLPYPGNYGFIPSTLMDTLRGGDGDALDVLIIGKRMESGQVVKCIPIGVIKLMDHGAADDKILAIPADPALRISDCETLPCFRAENQGLIEIVELWFRMYKGPGKMKFIGTLGADSARADIAKWAQF